MTDTEKRTSQLVIVTGFLVLYFLLREYRDVEVIGLLYASMIIGLGSLMSKHFSNLVIYLWFKIAHVLGWINTRILLTVLFYLFLFPIALLSRIFKKDALKMKRSDRSSIYVERNHVYTKKDLDNIW